jgi:hypothetical protein
MRSRSIRTKLGALGAVALLAVTALPAVAQAADAKPVDAATRQVGDGARQVREGEVLTGLGEMAKGVGNTVVEGAKYTGHTLAETGEKAWDVTSYGASEVSRLPMRLWQRLRTF